MIVKIFPSRLNGTVQAPPSKSAMQRACAAALLSDKKSIIKNYGKSNDDKTALEIIQRLGAEISYVDSHTISIKSRFPDNIPSEYPVIHCGESGLSVRMFTSIISLCESKITITGEGSLTTRPMHFFNRVLPEMGVQFRSHDGSLPFSLKGPIQPGSITIDGSLSSQYLTGLLFTFSHFFERHSDKYKTKSLTINVLNLKSRPYIDLTMKIMEDFGMTLPKNIDYEQFVFNKVNTDKNNSPIEYTVEGDWSGAAFLLAGGAINGNISIKGLDTNSTQADKRIIEALQSANTNIKINDDNIAVTESNLQAFEFDATNCPDLFPPLVALAAHCHGTSRITGTSRLTHKESNRGLTLQEEFAKLGVSIKLNGDEMAITGSNSIKGGTVSSRNDHRIAMACAVTGLKASAPVIIEDAYAIDKSYPDFYNHLQLLGGKIE